MSEAVPEKKPTLPNLDMVLGKRGSKKLPEGGETEPEAGDETPGSETKLFNLKITPALRQRMGILKNDPNLESITWEGLFDLFIHMATQSGIVTEDTIEAMGKTGGKTWDTVSLEKKLAYGLGTRWPEIGTRLQILQEEIKTSQMLLAGVQEALYEFVTTISAVEEAEREEPLAEEGIREGELFPTERTKA